MLPIKSLRGRFSACTLAFAILVGLAFALSQPAQATLLWDNGDPNGSNAFPLHPASTSFDDFTTGAPWTVTSVDFAMIVNKTSGNFSGPIEWKIYADIGDSPNLVTPLFSGNGINVALTPDLSGTQCCLSRYDPFNVHFDLDVPTLLQANTHYWLGLHLPQSRSTYWSTTFDNPTPDGGFTASTDVVLDVEDLSFKINGVAAATVPEPGALTLIGFGLAGLGVMRRRQRKRLS